VDHQLVADVLGSHDESGWAERTQSHDRANLKLGSDIDARQMEQLRRVSRHNLRDAPHASVEQESASGRPQRLEYRATIHGRKYTIQHSPVGSWQSTKATAKTSTEVNLP
jgi:hypothetical protein